MNTSTLFISHFSRIIIQTRCLFGVHHNPKRQIFYIKLNNNERATLLYKKNDNILDIKSVYVPEEFENRGIARLLAEAAFTYAIKENFNLILTCKYTQRVYEKIKSPELEDRVIGPLNLLKPL
ncbi:protein NATD1-like [Cotesia glomerata]|uniref:protein NATD1-like n=1 Tax=Cotesia glomerata TaxID=32391 RepID=UPI001D0030DC|nr:protein NATD1-like [Cotesia glomerata]